MTWILASLSFLTTILKAIVGYQSKAHDDEERQAGADHQEVVANDAERTRITDSSAAGLDAERLPIDTAINDPDNRSRPKAIGV